MADDQLTRQSGAACRDVYVSDLAARLRGPRRRRDQILAELRDGLDQAISDHRTADLPERDAVTAAITQFGTPQAVAQAFAGELAIAHARHTIAWYIATGPLVGIWWLLLLEPHPWHHSVVALLAVIPVIPLIMVAIATAVGAFASTGRLMRWLPEASPRQAIAATVTIAALSVGGDATMIAVYVRSDLPAHFLAVCAIAGSLIRIGTSVVAIGHATKVLPGGEGRSAEVGRVERGLQ
jgi:hypothetical protein